jgi:hypothetical protein
MRRQTVLVAAIVVCAISAFSHADFHEYALGDLDGGHYDGLGSADYVPIAPAWQGSVYSGRTIDRLLGIWVW